LSRALNTGKRETQRREQCRHIDGVPVSGKAIAHQPANEGGDSRDYGNLPKRVQQERQD
jgi:hypothetical protein